MKKSTGVWGLLVVAASVGLAVIAFAQTPAQPPGDASPISVKSFYPLPVGYLGEPLGTVVRVTGEAFDGNTTGWKADLGKTLLRIVTVNGKELAKPVVFEFPPVKASVKKLSPGDKFDYYVHEYGEFSGVVTPPKELGIETQQGANDGFHYRRYLSIHASNVVPK